LKAPSNNNSSVSADDLTFYDSNPWPTAASLELETEVYGDDQSIPYKR
jgi:hypothetical protein